MRPTPRFLVSVAAALVSFSIARAHPVATDMLAAAGKFLAALSPEQKQRATFPLTDQERENWNYVPMAREGIPLKAMNDAQHALALALLRTGLSHAGMARAEAVMSLELVLKELEGGAARRDPALYYVTIFGTPARDESWGWRFEGHHLSFNFTVVDGAHVFFAPSFIGSNPAEVRRGPRQGERVLRLEEDLGLALVNSLDDGQRELAVFSTRAPSEIVTGSRPRVGPLEPAGIAAAQLTPGQREKLLELVRVYLDRWRPELAAETFAEISAAGLDRIAFAWAGALARGGGTYYRIQGPTFLIEFDNTQNGANHVHTSYREFGDDFGRDALREHYAREHSR